MPISFPGKDLEKISNPTIASRLAQIYGSLRRRGEGGKVKGKKQKVKILPVYLCLKRRIRIGDDGRSLVDLP